MFDIYIKMVAVEEASERRAEDSGKELRNRMK